jgi:hypothetical protein
MNFGLKPSKLNKITEAIYEYLRFGSQAPGTDGEAAA